MRATLPSISLAAALLVSIATPASAAGGAAPSAAEQAFREGRAAVQAGDYPTACAKFNQSQSLEPAPGTLMNVADCEEHTGKLIAARDHFNLAASGFGRTDGRRAFALKRAADLDKRVARLTLRLAPGAPQGAQVRHGNEIVDASGQPAVVDPGDFDVVVSAPGREDRAIHIAVPEGATLEQSVDVGPEIAHVVKADPALEAASAARAASAKRTQTIGYVVGGVGVASLAVGVLTGVMAAGRAGTVKDHCDAAYACDSTGLDAASSGKTLAPISTVTLIAGVALVGAGTYLVVKGRSGRTTAFAPYVTPLGGGAGLAHTF